MNSRSWHCCAALALLALLTAGCGLKGPLYLPQRAPEAIPAQPAPGVPEEQQDEDGSSSQSSPQAPLRPGEIPPEQAIAPLPPEYP